MANSEYVRSNLKVISRHDPDGKPNKPTEKDYDDFIEWITATFGKDMVHTYYTWNED